MKDTKTVTIITASLDLPITSDEAFEYVHNPKGKTAKLMRKYLSELIMDICRKCLKKHKEDAENVKICNEVE